MKVISKIDEIHSEKKTLITLGKFDGVHRGHQKIFHILLEKKKNDELVTAFTFDMTIRSVLTGKQVQNLFSSKERRKLLENIGADILIECPFTEEIRTMDPVQFVEEILVGRLHASCIAIGDDFHFGYQRKGDSELLEKLSHKYGYEFIKVTKEMDHGTEISSTRIRHELLEGNVENVNELLGFPYFIEEMVIHGNHLGSSLGSPTINQAIEEGKLVPPFGVYFTRVCVDNVFYPGVTNVGIKPTVSNNLKRGAETYLIGYNGDLYGKTIKTEFYHFSRPEMKFDNIEMLKEQIQRDAHDSAEFWKSACLTKNKSIDIL